MNLIGYKIVLSNKAQKSLKKINNNDVEKILLKLNLLVTSNQTLDIKKIVSSKNDLYRLRHGNYRIIFSIYNQELIVLVIDVGHRREIYKNTDW
jgi:mRNA interferase RelE/StbE